MANYYWAPTFGGMWEVFWVLGVCAYEILKLAIGLIIFGILIGIGINLGFDLYEIAQLLFVATF